MFIGFTITGERGVALRAAIALHTRRTMAPHDHARTIAFAAPLALRFTFQLALGLSLGITPTETPERTCTLVLAFALRFTLRLTFAFT